MGFESTLEMDDGKEVAFVFMYVDGIMVPLMAVFVRDWSWLSV
jgi:hypothetical protein